MQDALQTVFLSRVGENGPTHLFPVQATVNAEKLLSEHLNYPLQRRLSRFDDFVCNPVGIGDGYTALRKQV